jgi:hypothetical protein
MNLGLVTSFIIAGSLMILIVTLNLRVSQHAQELTLHSMVKTHVEDISEIIQSDISKIGYDRNNPIANSIIVAEETIIEFRSNLFNGAPGTINRVRWELGIDPISNNPNHRLLTRTVFNPDGSIDVANSTEIALGVSRFQLNYFNQATFAPMATPVTGGDLDNIRRVQVILEVQPREGINRRGGDTYFPTSSWTKVIVPINLSLQ